MGGTGGFGRYDDVNPNTGVSRRQLIKRGAVVTGAAVWATPAIGSFLSPAGAQVGTPVGENPCPPGSNLAQGFVKYEVDEGIFVVFTGNSSEQNPDCIPADTGCAAISAHLAQHFNEHALVVVNGQQVCITIPSDCTMILAAAAKEGRPCDLTPDPGSDDPNAGPVRTVCFTKDIAGGVSNIQLQVECCIPDEVLAQCGTSELVGATATTAAP